MFGIGAQYYSHIYLILVALLSLLVFGRYGRFKQIHVDDSVTELPLNYILLVVLFSIIIGFRPVSGLFFYDMIGYNSFFENNGGEPFNFVWSTENIVFDNLLSFWASRFSAKSFFILFSFLYFGGIAWSCSLLFPQDKIAAFLVYLGAFSTFSYGTNGIKAGVAASMFLVALSLFKNRKWIWVFLFVALSWGLHHSMVLPVVAFVICYFVKNPKWFFALWVVCVILAFFHVTVFQEFFAGLTDERGASYLLGEEEHIRRDILGGFRIDFIIYSAVPIIIGWIAVYKKKIVSRTYSFLLSFYVLSNSVWLLCMYAEFTNRIAYLSWFVYPIVLIYPFLEEEWSENRYSTFQIVAFCHLGFTFFMNYVFYA